MANPTPGYRLPSWLSLGFLVGAFLLACVVWGLVLLGLTRPAHLDWQHLEALPSTIRDTFTIGMYLLLPGAIAWHWTRVERRPWHDLGLRFRGTELGLGLGMGAIGIVLVFGVAFKLGWAWPNPRSAWTWQALGLDVLVGLTMGFAEELLFRGVVLRTLLRDLPPGLALPLSALLFAVPHAVHPGQTLTWALVPFLSGLFATGLLFALATWSRGTLWLSTGMHAAWITAISLFSQFDVWVYDPSWKAWTGSGYPTSGLLAVLVMLGSAGTLWWTRPRETVART